MTCRISLTEWNGRRVLHLDGSDFLPQQQSEVRALAKAIFDSTTISPVLIDTSGLGLVGSCCLAALIELGMNCRKQGILCGLVESRSDILEVFEIVSIHSILPVFSSKEDALEQGC
ncbi:MAG: STAS domain-containing protein [Fibrobacteres bacterium]|jgi:anti-anti-sigma regulatory factor|nr:STAS domain-containing protein [Fibrobacterota bacterium]